MYILVFLVGACFTLPFSLYPCMMTFELLATVPLMFNEINDINNGFLLTNA